MADASPVDPISTSDAGLVCPECGDTIEPKGKATPRSTLGMHMRKEHGVASANSGAARTRRARPGETPPSDKPSRGISVLRDAADDAGAGKGKKAPSADDLSRGMGRFLGYGTIVAAGWAVDGDPRIDYSPDPETTRRQLINRLALKPGEAIAVVDPFAHMAAGTKLNAKYGRKVLDNIQFIDSLAILANMGREFSSYRRERNRIASAMMAGWTPGEPFPTTAQPTKAKRTRKRNVPPDPQAQTPQWTPPPATQDTDREPGDPFDGPTSPAPVAGVVVSADMVAQMRANRAQGDI